MNVRVVPAANPSQTVLYAGVMLIQAHMNGALTLADTRGGSVTLARADYLRFTADEDGAVT